MRRALLFALACLSLAVVGCTDNRIEVGGKNTTVIVRSIVSLSPSTTELASSYASRSQLVGRTAACNNPPTLQNVPIMAQVKPDYEKIASAKPDLVVYDAGLYNSADEEKLKQLGLRLFVFRANTVDGFIDELFEFGKLTRSETSASEYVDKIEQARALAKADPIAPKPTVLVMLPPTGGTDPMVAGTKSFVADVVRSVTAEPVGPDSERFEVASAETLMRFNPDKIVIGATQQNAAGIVNQFLADPRFKGLKAVQRKDIVVVNQDVLLRKGSRVDRLLDVMYRQLRVVQQ